MSYRQAGQVRQYVCDAEADLATIANPTIGSYASCVAEGSQWFHDGTTWQQDVGAGGGGGVDRFSLTMTEILFTETAGAGTYTATVPVDAGTIVLDAILYPLAAPWDADTAGLNTNDVLNGVGAYFGGVDLVGQLTTAYNPALPVLSTWDPTVGNLATLDSAGNIYYKTAYNSAAKGGPNNLTGPGVRYAAPDTITATVVTTGAGGTTGRLLVVLFGFGLPAQHIDATKT